MKYLESKPSFFSGLDRHYSVSRGALSQVFTLLEDLKGTQRVHSNLLHALVKKHSGVPETGEIPDDTTLPLESMGQLNELEGKLKDNTTRNKFVSLLEIYRLLKKYNY